MHMHGISNSSATFLPNVASFLPFIQEILNKVYQSSINSKIYSLDWLHCSYRTAGAVTVMQKRRGPMQLCFNTSTVSLWCADSFTGPAAFHPRKGLEVPYCLLSLERAYRCHMATCMQAPLSYMYQNKKLTVPVL